jgi:phage shock protein C
MKKMVNIMNTPKTSSKRRQKKRLFRSKSNKVIAGVCGGLGDYFDTDPVLIRVLFLVFLLAAGSTLLVYLIMWLIVPKDRS